MQKHLLVFRNGWVGRYTYNSLLLGKGHDEACRKPKGLHFIYPYLTQPFRHTYRHGCIAGYYYPMPTALLLSQIFTIEKIEDLGN